MALSEPEMLERARLRMKQEAEQSETDMVWMSFVDQRGRSLGVAIVRAPGPTHAIMYSHEQGCNPGGVVSMRCFKSSSFSVAQEDINRLLTKQQLIEKGYVNG